MKVIRRGRISDVKTLWANDIYIDKCYVCNSICVCTTLCNGYSRHENLKTYADNDLVNELYREYVNS